MNQGASSHDIDTKLQAIPVTICIADGKGGRWQYRSGAIFVHHLHKAKPTALAIDVVPHDSRLVHIPVLLELAEHLLQSIGHAVSSVDVSPTTPTALSTCQQA